MKKVNRNQFNFDAVIQNWHYHNDDVLDFFGEFTFSLTSMSRKKIHHRKVIFLQNGYFLNMKSSNLVSWEFSGDRINIFNKNKKLSHYILMKNIMILDGNIEFVVNDVKSDSTMLMSSDGKQENNLVEKKQFFSISEASITYKNDVMSLYTPVILTADAINIAEKKVIEINFDIKVESPLNFLPKDNFFVIAQHGTDRVTLLDLNLGEHLSINFENLPSNKWRSFSKKIDVSDKFVTIGLYLENKGTLVIKNISLSVY
ncbi:hypothetical protein [Pseudolactococcus carnosus]|uniref:hypothetical protein n=1 Tax=Pseudolactococcus carnosus TaxID=2749961 RepID=UPI001FB92E97|nr:hypothetical protein [Lactococcus carnosus]MBQ2635582.1 hypothetical protein [Methanobrevibacter sp.]MCJ1970981.1 hypothetical protein [Lactococcus carnosus]MCJ1980427.1 hypothetical protein [Lactococcus carnosus]MCJ2000490.1 hypothetical protein [Lactococcus carnosus]